MIAIKLKYREMQRSERTIENESKLHKSDKNTRASVKLTFLLSVRLEIAHRRSGTVNNWLHVSVNTGIEIRKITGKSVNKFGMHSQNLTRRAHFQMNSRIFLSGPHKFFAALSDISRFFHGASK